ncbi:mCG129573, isoform CRA_a [Mus musculus]|nr:mCG129573, isoform CRA_a [Mus musculus]
MLHKSEVSTEKLSFFTHPTDSGRSARQAGPAGTRPYSAAAPGLGDRRARSSRSRRRNAREHGRRQRLQPGVPLRPLPACADSRFFNVALMLLPAPLSALRGRDPARGCNGALGRLRGGSSRESRGRRSSRLGSPVAQAAALRGGRWTLIPLFSLMDMKPPISRAKMILITKAAIKAIKLYKHVVQIVEKFIKKCKPEYKVPGLYVIDSIVRQSRHQFGTDKDVFGPRFSKNITATFQYLYLCPSEDKSKIVRVLNLWQKNGVFKIEIIQPLLDMAAGTSNAAPVAENVTNNEGSPPPPVKISSELAQAPTNSMPTVAQLPSSDAFAAVAQLFQTTQGQQLQQILQTFQQPPQPQSPALDSAVMAQVQAITAQLKTAPTQPPEQKTAFDKKLLDRFDYDDEPEAVEDSKKEDAAAISTAALATAAPPAPTAATPAVATAVPVPSATSPPPPQTPFGYPGDGVQQPAYTQHQSMDQFQPRMMPIQQDTMHHQEMEVEQPCVTEVKRHVPESRKSRSRSASRGCAYIVMVHRQDAYRALQKLSRGNYKVNQKSIKIAWALNKGIKADYKQYWDVELGVTYIPWDKVKAEELESFCEGGMLDSDTLNPDWKGIPKKPDNEVAQNGGAETSHTEPVSPIPKPVPVPVPPIPVPAPITVPPPQQSPSQQPAPAQQQPPQFRNDSRQQFNSGRDQERFGRRSFGSRVENDRERYGSRNDDRDNSNRERREWGRRSPDRDRHRDLEERSRRSSGHRDRDRDSRDRESRREKEENRKEKHEVADRAGGNKAVEPPLSQVGTIDTVSELNKGEAMATVVKPEESPAEVTSPVGPEKDPGSAAEPPR